MKVCKFGGTSLADADHFNQIIKIITADPERTAVVVSAPGCRFSGDPKVTDLLVTYAKLVLQQQDYQQVLAKIIARYQAIAQPLGVAELAMPFIKQCLNQLPQKNF